MTNIINISCVPCATFFCLSFPFCLFSQVSIQSDIYVGNANSVAFHESEVHFLSGRIYSDNPVASEGFFSSAHALSTSHSSYSEVAVRSYGGENFIFPVGHQGVHQALQISEGIGRSPLHIKYHFSAHCFSGAGRQLGKV